MLLLSSNVYADVNYCIISVRFEMYIFRMLHTRRVFGVCYLVEDDGKIMNA
jgi:hypothetical protein